MLDKTRCFAKNRPSYAVDQNVDISAGQVAFLTANSAGVLVATTAASGSVPIGTFWKDASASYYRTTVETKTFNASGYLTLSGGNVVSTSTIKVTDSAGTTTYTQTTDYTIATANGVVTLVGGGSITAGETVIIWYEYTLPATGLDLQNSGSRNSRGTNYDRQPNDTLGSTKIAVVEGDATLFTDQYDPAQAYTLNAALRFDSNSKWTTAGSNSICGRVVKVPTSSDNYLGVAQVRVTA